MLVVFEATSNVAGAVGNDDVRFAIRLRCSAWPRSSATSGRRTASSRSTRRPTTAGGPRSCDRGQRSAGHASARPPRIPNETSQLTEQRVIALPSVTRAWARGGSARLAQERWGGISSARTAYGGCFGGSGLNRRISRLSLVVGRVALRCQSPLVLVIQTPALELHWLMRLRVVDDNCADGTGSGRHQDRRQARDGCVRHDRLPVVYLHEHGRRSCSAHAVADAILLIDPWR